MTRHIWHPAVADFVAARGERVDFGEYQALGFLDRSGVLECGFVYHDYNPHAGTIELSVAATNPRWATRERFRLAFGYPFTVGCQMLIGRTSEHNAPVRRGLKAAGATEYVIPRLLGRDRAGVLLTLTAEAWAGWKGHRP